MQSALLHTRAVAPACTKSLLWEGNLLLHCGVEPTLTELHTNTFFVVNGQVAEITFNFWYRLSEELYQRNNQVLTQVFRPYVQRLIIALCRHCQLDSDHVSVVCTRVVFLWGVGRGEAFILVCFPFAMMFDCFLGVSLFCVFTSGGCSWWEWRLWGVPTSSVRVNQRHRLHRWFLLLLCPGTVSVCV